MGPLWAPEQHTLAFRSNAPTSAHPGQTKSLCAASPLPPRPAPSTDVAPPPPPGGSPGRQPPEYGGRDVAVGTVTSPNGEHRVQPRAGDTGLSRAASPCGSDGTAGPGMVPSVPSRAQRKGVPVSSTSPGHGAARVARLQLRARHGRGTVGRKAGTARRCPPCASPAAPMPSARIGRSALRSLRPSPGSPPRYPPRRRDGGSSRSRTPPDAAFGAAPWTLYRPGRRPPLPNRSAALFQRRRCVPFPSPCLGVNAPPHGPVPSYRSLREPCAAGRGTRGSAHPHGAAPGVVGRSRHPNLMGKSAEGKNKQPLSTINWRSGRSKVPSKRWETAKGPEGHWGGSEAGLRGPGWG